MDIDRVRIVWNAFASVVVVTVVVVLTGSVMGVWSVVMSGVSAPHHVLLVLNVARRPVVGT